MLPTLAVAAISQQHTFFPAVIEGNSYQLEATLYRPDDLGRHPLVVMSHGRNGMFPARNPNEASGCAQLCRALAEEGSAVVFFVRRGYGNSDGPDVELQDTAVLSGLEAAKDYRAAVVYWRAAEFALPDRVVLMGQSQGGWSVLACTNVAMDGVLGVANISGGTNYRLMGTGAVTAAVQDHWVAGCSVLGAGALVPSYWIYAENDLSINGPTARRMFDAYTAAGGWGFLDMLPAYGSNGHAVVGQPDLFLPQLDDFLATIGFRDAARTAPAITRVSGPGNVNVGATAVLTVSLSANPLPRLQWRRDGADVHNGGNISGASSAALTISNAQAAESGNYTVVATNDLGTATSTPLVLNVVSPTPPGGGSNPPARTSSGGGGGAVSDAFVGALVLLTVLRLRQRHGPR
ncbi:MAG TPA: immunoglobulin domain-containing protein [Lacunisphaera sp.]|nr:immunoglobulin domain-containing protein [Lacunisphaera sp.]